jgi:phage gp36-like protein
MIENTTLNPLEQLTAILEKQQADIKELKSLRDNATSEEFRNAYQEKVTEQVKIYNDIVSRF